MTDPFVAEIRMFAGNFAPRGWALCNGQLMPIQQNTALFALLGTTYGGDGKSTFALPDLRGSAPMQQGQGPGLSQHFLGESGGTDSVTLQTSEMPNHRHLVNAVDAPGTQNSPQNAVWAQATQGRQRPQLYGAGNAGAVLSPGAVAATGGSQPHNNLPPYLVLNFIIALQGVYPQRP